jgi:hypothetical protein
MFHPRISFTQYFTYIHYDKMKISNSLVFFTVLAASFICAKPLIANECSNSSTNIVETSDSVSVTNRTRRAYAYFPLYSFTEESKNTVFACTVTERTIKRFVIPDDSSLSAVDVRVYINGRPFPARRMERGRVITLNLNPEKVNDYRIEFRLVELSDANFSGNIYLIE